MASFINLKPGRLVVVRWLDANHPCDPGWEDPNELGPPTLDEVDTVGFVQDVSNDAVRIVQTWASSTVLGMLTIPLKGIKTVTRLSGSELGECDKCLT